MKKLFTFFLSLFFIAANLNVHAQLTGIKTIPGDYPTIAAAITALNANGVGSGGVTFNVAAGHIETSSNLVITFTANAPTAANPVVFQKSGSGANPLITAAPGTSQNLDGIIKLSGADHITFDAIDLLDPPTNTGDAMMEWGYALLRASPTDGSQNVTIKNCSITLQKINVVSSSIFSIGIYIANRDLTGSTVNASDPDGQNSYNRIYGNNISNVYRGVQLISSSSARDVDNEIGVIGLASNSITNWGGGNQTAEGIRCEGQINLKITNNHINGGAGSTTFVNGIIATLFGAGANIINYEISHNTVTISGGTSNLQYAIRALATGDTVRIFNNVVENCVTPSSTASFFALAYEPTGTGNAAYIHNNIVRNNTHSGTGTMNLLSITGTINEVLIYSNQVHGNQKSGISGQMNCIRGPQGNVEVYSNTVYDNSIPNSSGTSASILYGYYNISSAGLTENVYNNSLYNLSIGGFSTSTSTVTYGIYSVPSLSSSSVSKNIHNNLISELNSNVGTVGGIFQQYGAACQIYANKIWDLSTNSTNTTNYAAGIIVAGALTSSNTATTIFNNFISNLNAPNSPNSNGVIGINSNLSAANTSLSVYYNSISLSAASTGGNFGSSGITVRGSATSTTAAFDMRNNIIINQSVPNGSGLTVVYRRSDTNLVNYSSSSNHNDLFAGTPSANRLIYYDGTNSIQTLADYKAKVSPRDINSISKDVNFVNPAVGDLHLAGASVGDTELACAPVSGITTDIDGDPRNPIAPYMGADEGDIPLSAGIVAFGIPEKFDLSQNYPNPFNPITKINFDLPFDSKVTMSIFDITGREVATLVNEIHEAGYYTVTFDAKDIASGAYFYRIIAEDGKQQYVMTKKMVLIR